MEIGGKDIKNDEWRTHLIAKKHVELEVKKYFEICYLKYDKSPHNIERNHSDGGFYHIQSVLDQLNQNKKGFSTSKIFHILILQSIK